MSKCILVHSFKDGDVYSAYAKELFNYSDNAPRWEASDNDYDVAVKEAIRLATEANPGCCLTGVCYSII